MQKMDIQTFDQLNDWLAENYYFEDGHVLEVQEQPLAIILGYEIKGNFKANTERHILSYKIIPESTIEWTFDRDIVSIGENNYIVGVEVLKVEKGLCLEFSTPIVFRLTAESLTIEEQPLIETTFTPWVSTTELFLTATVNAVPTPQYWKDKLKEYGHDIVFRYYAGEQRHPEQVPYPDYQGYYIQLSHRIEESYEGIFLPHVTVKDGTLNLSFENKDEQLQPMWEDLTRILADLPNATIYSGNCEFTGAEWKQYLKDGTIPVTKE